MYISRIYLKCNIMDNQSQEIATDHIVADESSQDAILKANVVNLNTLDASEEQLHTR